MNDQDSVNVGTKHSSGVSVESPRPAQARCPNCNGSGEVMNGFDIHLREYWKKCSMCGGTGFQLQKQGTKQIADAMAAALSEVLNVMDIQEHRDDESFHLSQQAFRPMWNAAKDRARAALATHNVTARSAGTTTVE